MAGLLFWPKGLQKALEQTAFPEISLWESDLPVDVWDAPLPNEDKHGEWESIMSHLWLWSQAVACGTAVQLRQWDLLCGVVWSCSCRVNICMHWVDACSRDRMLRTASPLQTVSLKVVLRDVIGWQHRTEPSDWLEALSPFCLYLGRESWNKAPQAKNLLKY